jgi:hypothetical protein
MLGLNHLPEEQRSLAYRGRDILSLRPRQDRKGR